MLINKRIVLTDDDADDRWIFSTAFHELKFDNNLLVLSGGTQLMHYLQTTEKLPQLIFIDLNMPRKSGFECLREIRSNPKFRNVSIAIYSTSSSESDIIETYNGGADVYICKPNDYDDLKKVLKTVLLKKWHHLAGFDRKTFLVSA